MREYQVTIPVAGHAYLTVQAKDEEDAIAVAMDTVTLSNIEECFINLTRVTFAIAQDPGKSPQKTAAK